MYTIKNEYDNEIVINKSRFITHLFSVKSIDEISLILKSIRKKYYDATHNCYAYILGENQDIQKASDDGEPQKTAGFPMLDVLKKRQMTNVLAITTRYFGGILLGAGGLVRAYSSSVSEALDKSDIYEYKTLTKLNIVVSFKTYNIIEKELKKHTIININYLDNVIIELGIVPDLINDFMNRVNDLSNGQISISTLGDFVVEVLIKHNEF